MNVCVNAVESNVNALKVIDCNRKNPEKWHMLECFYLWFPISVSCLFESLYWSPPSQVHWPLHQVAGGECWITRRWGEEKHRPSSWGHRKQDVSPLPWWSQVQAGYWHCPGNQTTWHVWEDHPGVGQHYSPSVLFCDIHIYCLNHQNSSGGCKMTQDRAGMMKDPDIFSLPVCRMMSVASLLIVWRSACPWCKTKSSAMRCCVCWLSFIWTWRSRILSTSVRYHLALLYLHFSKWKT